MLGIGDVIRFRNPCWSYSGAIGPTAARSFLCCPTPFGRVGNFIGGGHEGAILFQRPILEDIARIGVTIDFG
jgi:hypothetical protein